ncbi:hypothetical protein LINGRAHAP2_LOCUS9608 [Linum grandiflorum]
MPGVVTGWCSTSRCSGNYNCASSQGCTTTKYERAPADFLMQRPLQAGGKGVSQSTSKYFSTNNWSRAISVCTSG